LFYEPILPFATPSLQAFFAQNRSIHCIVHFVIDERFDAVFFREAFYQALIVLRYSLSEVTRHADVERTIRLAGKNVDARTSHDMQA